MCDLTCGAITFSEHAYTERCVDGMTFQKWEMDRWTIPNVSDRPFYTAKLDDGTFQSTTSTPVTTTPTLLDLIEINGALTHSRYNGIYEAAGVLNSQTYYQKEYNTFSRSTAYHYIFVSESGLWKISNELGSVWADYYTSGSDIGLAEGTAWFVNSNSSWVIETSIQVTVRENFAAVDECQTYPDMCNDQLKYCNDRLVGYECLCISGYSDKSLK